MSVCFSDVVKSVKQIDTVDSVTVDGLGLKRRPDLFFFSNVRTNELKSFGEEFFFQCVQHV